MTDAGIQMPQYQCHKKVWALKIKEVRYMTRQLIFEDTGYAERTMTYDYMNKHSPKAGGYFVVYEDGYESFSPAEAFESGYALINSPVEANIKLQGESEKYPEMPTADLDVRTAEKKDGT